MSRSECGNTAIDWSERLPVDSSFKSSTKVTLQSGISLPQSLDNIGFMRFTFPNGNFHLDTQQVIFLYFLAEK